MSHESRPNGVGATERQLDWSPWSVTEDVALDGYCSKRKRAFFQRALPKGLTILERSAQFAHPKAAPWHITTGVCKTDEIAEHVMDMNWSGWWFRHMCRAADILKIPCSEKRFADEDHPWNKWGQTIELKLKQRISQNDKKNAQLITQNWKPQPFYLGNRFPHKKGDPCECSISLPEESLAIAQLAKQASQLDASKDLVIPAVLQKYFLTDG